MGLIRGQTILGCLPFQRFLTLLLYQLGRVIKAQVTTCRNLRLHLRLCNLDLIERFVTLVVVAVTFLVLRGATRLTPVVVTAGLTLAVIEAGMVLVPHVKMPTLRVIILVTDKELLSPLFF